LADEMDISGKAKGKRAQNMSYVGYLQIPEIDI